MLGLIKAPSTLDAIILVTGLMKNGTGAFLTPENHQLIVHDERSMEDGNTVHNHLHHQKRRQAALGVVHEILVPHPRFRFPADLALFSCGISLRDELLPAKVGAEILDNHGGLGQNEWLRAVGCGDGDDGGFTQRLNLFQLVGCCHVGLALEGLDLVGDVEFFQEPDDPLSAGLFQPGPG